MKNLTEKEAEDFLEKKGFKVVERILIKTIHDLKKVENKIKFPWVMKISSQHIAHKSKIGGTILNIDSIPKAIGAFNKLKKIKKFNAVLIQPIIRGEELIIGVKKTPEFSHVLMFGKGGTNVEEEKDISFRVIPLNEKDATEMIKETKIYKIIKSKINEKQVIKNILLISKLIEKNKEIYELDINPLIVNKKDAIVVDARLQFE